MLKSRGETGSRGVMLCTSLILMTLMFLCILRSSLGAPTVTDHSDDGGDGGEGDDGGEGTHDDDPHETGHDNDHNHDWGYFGIYGPSNWSVLVPECSSTNDRQSPIDIIASKTRLLETLDEITLKVSEGHNHDANIEDNIEDNIAIVNNGHTVSLGFNRAIHVVGGDLGGGTFKVGGIHFHWGKNDSTGSEHTINRNHYPLEMHIVTFDESRFAGVKEAADGVNSLAVLGVLFEISEEDNKALDPIIGSLSSVRQPKLPMNMSYFDPKSLLPQDTYQYYRYLGSLTTPPCAQSVIWTVFEHPQYISSSQLAQFRLLLEGPPEADGSPDYLDHNWRPVQPLYKRTVYRSFIFHHSKTLHSQDAVKQQQPGAYLRSDGVEEGLGEKPMQVEKPMQGASSLTTGAWKVSSNQRLLSLCLVLIGLARCQIKRSQ